MASVRRIRGLFRGNWLPYLVFLCYVLAWGGCCNVLFKSSVHVYSCWMDGTRMPLRMEWALGVFHAAPMLALANFVFLGCILIFKRVPPWWILMACLGLLGTPIAIWVAQVLADYLWEVNQGGIAWEYTAPSAIAFLLVILPWFWAKLGITVHVPENPQNNISNIRVRQVHRT